jgi:hypothetical protein
MAFFPALLSISKDCKFTQREATFSSKLLIGNKTKKVWAIKMDCL